MGYSSIYRGLHAIVKKRKKKSFYESSQENLFKNITRARTNTEREKESSLLHFKVGVRVGNPNSAFEYMKKQSVNNRRISLSHGQSVSQFVSESVSCFRFHNKKQVPP